MSADRYLNAVLTVIALELGYLALMHSATPVTAQAQATPVVITGIELNGARNFLPVGVLGQIPPGGTQPSGPVQTVIENEQPLRVSLPMPLDVRTVAPVLIDMQQPLKVENVGYTGTPTPR